MKRPALGMASRLAAGAYGLAWRVASPLLRRNARMADGFAERLVPDDWMQKRADIWIQAASGGEARLAIALVQALHVGVMGVCQEPDAEADIQSPQLLQPSQPQQSSPSQQITAKATPFGLCVLVTTWTRQGYDILERGRQELEQAHSPVQMVVRFVPLDDPALVERAVAQTRPGLMVLLETELWPGLLYACARRQIPVLFANARMREATARRYALAAPVWRRLAPEQVCAIAAPDAERFARVFPGVPVTVIPNIKFDLAVPPSSEGISDGGISGVAARVAGLLPDDHLPRVLFASVREEEEQVLMRAMAERLGSGSKPCTLFGRPVRLIIAPRHLHRVAAWQAHLTGLGFTPCLRSHLEAPGAVHALGADTPIIWDAFGELTGLYHAVDAVFVGGSLAPQARLGGQNFLEPLAAGVVPYVGPDTSNFAWTLDAGSDGSPGLEVRGLIRRVPDAPTLLAELAAELAVTVVTPATSPVGPTGPTGSATSTGPTIGQDRAAVRGALAAWLGPRLGGAARTAAVALRMLAASPASL